MKEHISEQDTQIQKNVLNMLTSSPKNLASTRMQKILDFACGPGLVGQSLKEKGFSNITGLEISQKMINIAK